jgi:hypothetical protein
VRRISRVLQQYLLKIVADKKTSDCSLRRVYIESVTKFVFLYGLIFCYNRSATNIVSYLINATHFVNRSVDVTHRPPSTSVKAL